MRSILGESGSGNDGSCADGGQDEEAEFEKSQSGILVDCDGLVHLLWGCIRTAVEGFSELVVTGYSPAPSGRFR